MSDSRVLEKLEGSLGVFLVSCKFKTVGDQQVQIFSGVYSPIGARDKSLMWDELISLHVLWDVPWYLGWDFNVVRFPPKKWALRILLPRWLDYLSL